VPVVSRFFGIVIAFYWTELVENWERARRRAPLAYIAGLE